MHFCLYSCELFYCHVLLHNCLWCEFLSQKVERFHSVCFRWNNLTLIPTETVVLGKNIKISLKVLSKRYFGQLNNAVVSVQSTHTVPINIERDNTVYVNANILTVNVSNDSRILFIKKLSLSNFWYDLNIQLNNFQINALLTSFRQKFWKHDKHRVCNILYVTIKPILT